MTRSILDKSLLTSSGICSVVTRNLRAPDFRTSAMRATTKVPR